MSNAIQALPDPYRAIVLLRYWDGLAPREIARLRGIPLATVKTQLQRGLGRLRAQLGEEPPTRLRALATLSSTLLMHTQTKLIGAALALGALGLWGLAGSAWRIPNVKRAADGDGIYGACLAHALGHGFLAGRSHSH